MTDAKAACIVGIGETEFTKWGGIKDRSQFQLACEAILAAAADAGIDPEQIDGISSYANDENEAIQLQVALGMPVLRWSSMVWSGGGGGSCGAVASAKAAVEAGFADYVVVFRSLCQGQGRRFGHARPNRKHASFLYPYGLFSAAQMLAMATQRHMHLFGTTSEQMGHIALTCRQHAARNPHAVMGERPMTMDDYLASRFISEPFRLFDCCLESDGACAIIVTSYERAKDLKGKPAFIQAAAYGGGAWGAGSLGSMNQDVDDYVTSGAVPVARDLWAKSGMKAGDVDVVQVYENFTGIVLMVLEDFGFCKKGEGGPLAESGSLRWPDGATPMNTAGGNLSEAYIHGLNHVLEAVRQIRGTSTAQVPDAEVCLVTGGPGIVPTSALILVPA